MSNGVIDLFTMSKPEKDKYDKLERELAILSLE